MIPPIGKFRMLLPLPLPIGPLGCDVYFDGLVLHTPFGNFPYSASQDWFVAGPDSGVECSGAGTYSARFLGTPVVGNCSPN